MKMKRILCTALSAALLCSAALAANTSMEKTTFLRTGTDQAAEETPPSFSVTQNRSYPIMVYGKAALEENRILLTNDNPNAPHSSILIRLDENTPILDAVTGARKTVADLREGETLYAYVSSAMTRSLPPQTSALLVLCNIPADYRVPIYAEVEQVTVGEDGKVSALMSGDIVLHLDGETELLSYETKNVVGLDDIKPGARLLSWYGMVMESYPAKASPSKVMVFPYGYDGYASVGAEGGVCLNGAALTAETYVADGVLMVPVRAFAEALGCEVVWSAKEPDRVRVLRDGREVYTLTIGGKTAVLDGDMAIRLERPPVAIGGVTYLEAERLISFHGLKLEGQWPVLG